MSKRQTIKAIRQELDKLNQEIDMRIIRGVSYIQEARRHRFLQMQLRRYSAESWSWFTRTMSLVSTFIF